MYSNYISLIREKAKEYTKGKVSSSSSKLYAILKWVFHAVQLQMTFIIVEIGGEGGHFESVFLGHRQKKVYDWLPEISAGL